VARGPVVEPRAVRAKRSRRQLARSNGTTLIEALIAIAVLSLLLSAAVPNFRLFVSRHRAMSAAEDFVHAIAVTRGEALKRGRRVYLAPRDGRWRNGWAVFVDRNDNRVYDGPDQREPDEAIALHDALPDSVEVANSAGSAFEPFSDALSPRRSYLMFDGGGYSRQRNGALHFGGIVFSDRSATPATVRTVCLGSYGRVRVVPDRPSC